MSQDKHTPGPWVVQRYRNHVGWSVFALNRGCIAERWYSSPSVTANIYPDAAEMEANARLIAAAPDLLEALRVAFARSCERADSRVKWTAQDQRAHEAIKAAIAKAEGGAS